MCDSLPTGFENGLTGRGTAAALTYLRFTSYAPTNTWHMPGRNTPTNNKLTLKMVTLMSVAGLVLALRVQMVSSTWTIYSLPAFSRQHPATQYTDRELSCTK